MWRYYKQELLFMPQYTLVVLEVSGTPVGLGPTDEIPYCHLLACGTRRPCHDWSACIAQMLAEAPGIRATLFIIEAFAYRYLYSVSATYKNAGQVNALEASIVMYQSDRHDRILAFNLNWVARACV